MMTLAYVAHHAPSKRIVVGFRGCVNMAVKSLNMAAKSLNMAVQSLNMAVQSLKIWPLNH